MMKRVCMVALVVLVVALLPDAGGIELEYSCNPSGSITVANPDPSTYIGAFAKTSDGAQNCTCYVLQIMSVIMISECPTSKNITLYLLRTVELPVIITDEIDFHIIRCQQIPATGVFRKVTDESWVTNIISTSMEPSVTPAITMHTQIEDIETGVKRETAIVGEPLLWDIEGPEGYTVLPENCTVSSGAGAEAIQMVENGCSLDTYLLEHFEYVSETQKHLLQANLYAFRFASSSEIYIVCWLLGCHNTSTACDFTCPSEKRRRRSNYDDHVQQLIENQRQQSGYQAKPSRDAYRPADLAGEVSVKLKVFGLDELAIKSGASRLHDRHTGFIAITTMQFSFCIAFFHFLLSDVLLYDP